jgi:ribosomal protein L37AE/L43A
MKCPWGCEWEGLAAEYTAHYKICPKKVCPSCNSTNVFFIRVDEIECITCGHTWKKGETLEIDEAPQAEEERTWLIRARANETLTLCFRIHVLNLR